MTFYTKYTVDAYSYCLNLKKKNNKITSKIKELTVIGCHVSYQEISEL